MAGMSRNELLQWLNELLALNYNKVEQCGTGAAYCQIIDSIYGNVPLAKVKFNAKFDYEYVANFKVLQTYFTVHKIDKPIPVEALVKCKMQDNLEFLQWIRKYWDETHPGHEYDAVARRKGRPAEPPATIAPLGPSRGAAPKSASLGANAQPARGKTPVGGKRTPLGGAKPVSNAELIALQNQLAEMTVHLEGLEKERDFYFSKLRDIEILAQQRMEVLEGQGQADDTLTEIQKILYSTEEGFEVPEGGGLEEEDTF